MAAANYCICFVPYLHVQEWLLHLKDGIHGIALLMAPMVGAFFLLLNSSDFFLFGGRLHDERAVRDRELRRPIANRFHACDKLSVQDRRSTITSARLAGPVAGLVVAATTASAAALRRLAPLLAGLRMRAVR